MPECDNDKLDPAEAAGRPMPESRPSDGAVHSGAGPIFFVTVVSPLAVTVVIVRVAR